MPPEAPDRPVYAVTPQVVAIATLVLVLLADWLLPLPFLPQVAAVAIGIPVLAAGVALWVWGGRTFRRGGERTDPREATRRVLANGAFRVSRNPIYAGFIIAMIGLALLLDTLLGLGVAVAAGSALHFLAILPEERYLEAKFGDAYREYRGQVRRWL